MEWLDATMLALLAGLPLSYVVVQYIALTRWTGGLRIAAAVPLPLWLVWGAILVVDLFRDPTSHNLLPFEILLGAIVALVYLAFLQLVRLTMPQVDS